MPITTVIFDAYGTLLDVSAAARDAAAEDRSPQLAEAWPKLAQDWRAKQLEYSWLRAITGDHCDFWTVTQNALDWALEAQALTDPALRARLLDLYRDLQAFPEAKACLEALRARGLATGILSNGSPNMLASACDAAGISGLLDHVLSVEEVGVFKPSPRVYDLVGTRFGAATDQVLFVSSNGWDAGCAAAYGFTTTWVNRADAPIDQLPGRPAHIVPDLSRVPNLIAPADHAPQPAAPHQTPDGAQFFTTDDGLRLAYDDAGEGIPLICLAGLTRNMTDFDFVRPNLLERCRVIRMDYRGRGRSDFDSNYQNYNVLREAHDVIGLIDHLGLERAAILGTSRGGIISMVLAGSHKDRLLGVCLNDIGPILEPEGLEFIFGYLGISPEFRTYDEAADGMLEGNAKRFPGVSRDRWRAHAEHLWRETPDGLALRYDKLLRQIVLEQSASETMPDMWLLFEALKDVPLALIHGANSDLLSAETAAEMQRRRPDMSYAKVPDRGHVPFLDEPEALDLIARFLDGLSVSSKADTAAV